MSGAAAKERRVPAWGWLLLASLFAAGTAVAGWESVPVLAAAVAAFGGAGGWRASSGGVAAAAALGWAALLGWDLAGARAGELARVLAGLTGLPPVGATLTLALVTLAFAALLAWAAATLARWAVLAARGTRAERAGTHAPPSAPTRTPGEVTLPAAPPAGSPVARS